jgi:hypothetical protein
MFHQGITGEPVLSEIVDLRLGESINHLHLTKAVVRRGGFVPDEQHIRGLKEFARRTIESFSHTREKEKLRRYVDDYFVIGHTFALGTLMLTLQLVSRGIKEFSRQL